MKTTMTKRYVSATVALSLLLGGSSVIGLQRVALAADAPKKDDHKDHDHKKDGKVEEHKGEKKDLGSQKAGAYTVQVTQVGDVTPGAEAVFIITPKGEGEPKAVRAWVGAETGKGSIKTKAEEEKEGEWHAHHQVSKPLPAGSKLWVELETAGGKQMASFATK